jgi:hypothetical protein
MSQTKTTQTEQPKTTALSQTNYAQTQTEQAETSSLAVDFSHRLAFTDCVKSGTLTDSLGLMTSRALGVLNLLSVQFEGDVSRMSDDLIYCAIDAAIHEIEDIKALSKAYSQAQYAKRKP